MSQKLRKITALLLIFTLAFVGMSTNKTAKAENVIETTDRISTVYPGEPGQVSHIEIPITSKALLAVNNITAEPKDDAPLRVENVKLLDLSKENELTNLYQMNNAIISFDVIMDETATIGNYYIDICFSGYGFIGIEEMYLSATPVLTACIQVQTEKEPIQLILDSVNYNVSAVKPGNKFSLELGIKNAGEIDAYNAHMSLSYDQGMIPAYNLEQIRLGSILAGRGTTKTVQVEVLPEAEVGSHVITVHLTCKDKAGKVVEATRALYVNVKSEVKPDQDASLELVNKKIVLKAKADTKQELNLKLQNTGNIVAKDVKLSVVSGIGTQAGIIKGYSENYVKAGDIEAGTIKDITIPLKLTKDVEGGLKELVIEVDYFSQTKEKKESVILYLDVDAAEVVSKTAMYTTVNNVSQSPAYPTAGGSLTVSFDINNSGDEPMSNVRVSGVGLSSNGFEPINSEPYKAIGDIKANKSKRVTMEFKVGKGILEGLNTLQLKYQYFDGEGQAKEEQVELYILNVQNPQAEETVSKPKLIVSNYFTDQEELRAGSVFNYTFELTNTHATKSAKNITVTITQDQDVFSSTKGSNSFYIPEIKPGESAQNTLEMKVNTNTATGSYPLNVAVQYEYDEMSEVDKQKGGAEESYTLKLNAIENSRPMIENIYMETWDGVYVGTDFAMYFEFYNMGMSALNNVYVTVEGDFVLSNNAEMKYVGSLQSYMSEYVDLMITPLVEGDAQGKLIVHFEDSTGTELMMSSDINTFVQGSQDFGGFDDGGYFPGEDWGGDYPGGEFGDQMGEEVSENILPLWLFVVIMVGLVLISMPIAYKIRISIKKKKLLKELEEE